MPKRKESLNVTKLFPSWQQWSDFLDKQPKARVTNRPDRIDKYTARIEPTYRTPKGVHNTVDYVNQKPGKAVALKPYMLSQRYTDKQVGYAVEIFVDEKRLETNLGLRPTSDNVVNLIVSSMADKSSGRWTYQQEVLMALSEKYLSQLKTDGVLPNIVKSRIWIENTDGITKVTIEGQDNERILLNEEVLREYVVI